MPVLIGRQAPAVAIIAFALVLEELHHLLVAILVHQRLDQLVKEGLRVFVLGIRIRTMSVRSTHDFGDEGGSMVNRLVLKQKKG